MRKIAVLSFAVMLVVGLHQVTYAAAAKTSDGWVSLFNGKVLTGWDGDLRLWSVMDGAIHGETTTENPAVTYGSTAGRIPSFESAMPCEQTRTARALVAGMYQQLSAAPRAPLTVNGVYAKP